MKQSDNDNNVFPGIPETSTLPSNIDRRTFIIRNAVIGAAAAMTGSMWTREARADQATKEAAKPKLGGGASPVLNVVKQSKGPIMTLELAHDRADADHL